jgi:hypothetical protein
MIDTMMKSLALEVAQVYFLGSVLKAMREVVRGGLQHGDVPMPTLDSRSQLGDPEYICNQLRYEIQFKG